MKIKMLQLVARVQDQSHQIYPLQLVKIWEKEGSRIMAPLFHCLPIITMHLQHLTHQEEGVQRLEV